jgi:putative ABC transport system permease protein
MGIPVLAGRALTEQDAEGAPPVAMINENLARKYWSNQEVIGKRIKLGPNPQRPWISVVGVVKEVRNFGPETEPRPEVYVSYLQAPSERMRLVVRTGADPMSLVSAVREQVRRLDRDLPFSQVMSMEQLFASSVAQRRLNMLVMGIFAAVALLLAAMGIYGVMSYTVVQRTHEIGIRMALGARPGDVLRLVAGQGFMLALVGAAVGLAAAFALTRLMKTLLFDVSANDPVTFVVIALLLLMVTLAACYLPARRAARVDPMVALRYE